MNINNIFNNSLSCLLIFLAIGIFFLFFKSIKATRFTDRIVCINLISTFVTCIICVLSVYLDIPYLVDVALVYTLLSFLSIIIICRVVTLHHKGREHYLKDIKNKKSRN